ncbi:Transducin beta-like protein 3, partial [Mucuna pruriens]
PPPPNISFTSSSLPAIAVKSESGICPRSSACATESDHTLKVWSMDGLSDDMTVPINLKAKAVVAAHDKDINSVAVDRTATILRLPDLVLVVVFKRHKKRIWSFVVTVSGDKTIRMWAISNDSCLKKFEGHTSSVLGALFVIRATQIVSCGIRLSVVDFVLSDILIACVINLFNVSSANGLVKLWIVKTNECVAMHDHHEDKVPIDNLCIYLKKYGSNLLHDNL